MSPSEDIDVLPGRGDLCVWSTKPTTVTLHGFDVDDPLSLDDVRTLRDALDGVLQRWAEPNGSPASGDGE